MALNIEATDFGRSLRRCVDVFRAPHVVDVHQTASLFHQNSQGKLSDSLLERSRRAPLKFVYTMTLKMSRSSEDCADSRTNVSVCVG